ncbi:UDP-N-acetylglucosamine-dolichyl-phosphate N-acetylglucosamine phosphotransferase [Secundilactobacillus oryzae JCM 18671]|uniref:UDP-N-acetylglucosamine--N-acetylmuramyl-(pentapeptide) pyrophosphoryl-undecaprenol N-acetylglucosamine transferase n=1 Tax=Secundilactobacillus oryzae JCM 18671 TaxID=1291743 RepID=A0A081BGL7_9LACO|nr:undecaprenyldiphospho-muramoylpentapeptide beta-N-acetylglucosaminyltransferase [Secundilactobacillus oryzae]GAK47185.1 UDP-N-acetylglucosamine-dolichyl-phosphate N-acetylglucosamine phosphotransferase [Secundilactobacillus oryzae JCM 18671]
MRLMISGGGTGGHIYPALALINDLKKHDTNAEVLFVGSNRGLESQIVPKQGIDFEAMEIQGFKRSLSLQNFKTVYLFLKSVKRAKQLIKTFKPDVVVGTGGYVSGAVVYAAAKMHIPTMIHEQNSVVGITNKFLARYVDKIAINFDDARAQFPEAKVVKTGNPRAQEMAETVSHFKWSDIGLSDDKQTVLIFGGSQGALKLNRAVVAGMHELADRQYQVLFVTGPKRYDEVMLQLNSVDLRGNVLVKPYIDGMPELLPKVDLIVSRAGATSIAEITALGIPAILIPSPYVTADHQTKNAMSVVNAGAAKMLTEEQLNADTLIETIDSLMLDDKEREMMGKASKATGNPKAADEMLAVLESIAKK